MHTPNCVNTAATKFTLPPHSQLCWMRLAADRAALPPPLCHHPCITLSPSRPPPSPSTSSTPASLPQDSPLLPNLVFVAALYGVKLALLDAHLAAPDLLQWHAGRGSRRRLGQLLGSFSLIVPRSDVVGGRVGGWGRWDGAVPA